MRAGVIDWLVIAGFVVSLIVGLYTENTTNIIVKIERAVQDSNKTLGEDCNERR